MTEVKIPENLTHKAKLQKKVKEMLKDVDNAREQMDEAKVKIEKENAKEVNLTDMDSKKIKMKKGYFD